MAITNIRKTSIILDEFTSSGIWYKPAGAVQVTVEVIGGGGGGSGGDWPSGTSTTSSPRYGGQGGEAYYGTFVDPDVLPETVAVLVGNGGTGGASPATIDNSPSNGGAGTSSSFGSIVVAGGAGGTASNPSAAQRSYPFVWPYAATGYPVLTPSVLGGQGAPAGVGFAGYRNEIGGGAGGVGGYWYSTSAGTHAAATAGGKREGISGYLWRYGPDANISGGGGNAGLGNGSTIAPTAGSAGTAGSGGGGGGAANKGAGALIDYAGKPGGNGGVPGGGGGGAGASYTSAAASLSRGAGGNGGAGRVRVWTLVAGK